MLYVYVYVYVCVCVCVCACACVRVVCVCALSYSRRLCEWVDAELPPPPSEAIATLYPPWFAAFCPPLEEHSTEEATPPAQLLKFTLAGLHCDDSGVEKAKTASRSGARSRVIAMLGRAGAGRSTLAR